MEKSALKLSLYVETFGCQMNAADSEELGRAFLEKGVALTSAKSKADILILNTCTVRDHAEQKALSYIGRLKPWKKEKPDRILIVAGCAAERLKTSLKRRFPHVDLVVGAKSIEDFPQVLDEFFHPKKKTKTRSFDWFTESEKSFTTVKSRASGEPLALGTADETAFVTIMRGCNYSCSYCIVPSVRGREKYRDPKSILTEVKEKAATGLANVMLLGQTVNSYWFKDPEGKMVDFSGLVAQVHQIPEVREIKFMSPHPHYMSDQLIETLSALEKISPQIHLPVQSGSDRILKDMKRNYTRGEYAETARKLRAAVPNLQLSTDFIVGFPGETEEDFEETLSLAAQVRFSMAFCFKYSSRAGTEASCFRDDVPRAVKEDRLARLLSLTNVKKESHPCSAESLSV